MPPSTRIPVLKITEVKQSHRAEKDFELYRFDYFAYNIDHLRHPHRHDHFALFFVTKGEGSHLIDFKDYDLSPKRIFLIAPGQVHAWNLIKGVEGFVLLFTREFFTLTLQYRELRSYLLDNIIYQKPYFDLDNESYVHLESIFRNMAKENVSVRKYSQNIIRSYINIVLFEISRLYEQSIPFSASTDRAYLLVKKFGTSVNANFRTIQSVSQYAKTLYVTPSYLNSICKKYKGKSAGEIIHDRVILEAKRLLAHSEDTAAQIASDLNFRDNSYFGRFFKKYTGKTPAQFREEVKNEVIGNQ